MQLALYPLHSKVAVDCLLPEVMYSCIGDISQVFAVYCFEGFVVGEYLKISALFIANTIPIASSLNGISGGISPLEFGEGD